MREYRGIDTLPAREAEKIQGELLLETVSRAYGKSPYYKGVFGRLGIVPTDIKGLEDLGKLPVTDRDSIQRDNWSLLSVPQGEIAEIVSTTGTTGEPAFVAMTKADLGRLAYNEEKGFKCAGTKSGERFHMAVTSDNLFIAGVAYYSGIMRLGASVVRVGPQNILRHLELIEKLRPTGIVAVPSFLVHLARQAEDAGISVREMGIKRAVLIGDSIRNADFTPNALGNLIEEKFGGICFSTYGLTEAQLSFTECEERLGLHGHPDLVIPEVLDEEGKPVPDGEEGELVLTPLQVEGMPLIRYRTGDYTFIVGGPCPCGRNSVRIGPIIGRKHHRLKVKGVTLYPKNIENAVLNIPEVVNYQIEAYTGGDETDHVILRVGSLRDDNGLRAALLDALRAKARVAPEIEIEHPDAVRERLFEGGSRKPIAFKDRRSGAAAPGRIKQGK